MDKRTARSLALALTLHLSVGAVLPIGAADTRTEPIDAYILIDVSAAMGDSVKDAAEWVCGKVIDDLFIAGDRVTVWSFSADTRRHFEQETLTAEGKERIKAAIRNLRGDGGKPAVADALGALLRTAESRKEEGRLAYLLMASSLVESGDSAADKLLKHSRVAEQPGWKAVVVGVGIERAVAEKAALFLTAAIEP